MYTCVYTFNIWNCVCVLSCFSSVQLCATLQTVACQIPLSVEFSRQEYWSGLRSPPLGDLYDSGIEPMSLNISCTGRQVLYLQCHLGSPHIIVCLRKYLYVYIYQGFQETALPEVSVKFTMSHAGGKACASGKKETMPCSAIDDKKKNISQEMLYVNKDSLEDKILLRRALYSPYRSQHQSEHLMKNQYFSEYH